MRQTKKHIEPPCKTKIRLAAIKLFAERGIDNVAVKDIMRAARTTQPMLYYYFGCKDKLCERIYGDLMSEAVNGAGDIMASKAGLEAKLAELFNFHSTFFASHPGATRFILQGFLSPHYGHIHKARLRVLAAAVAYHHRRPGRFHRHYTAADSGRILPDIPEQAAGGGTVTDGRPLKIEQEVFCEHL